MANPVSHAYVSAVHPMWAVEGGRVDIEGTGFAVEGDLLPEVWIGGIRGRVVFASPQRIGVLVPPGIPPGRVLVEVVGSYGGPVFLTVAGVVTTGIHQVDNPVFGPDGSLYVTNSGSRGESVPVSVFRVRPSGEREPYVTGIVNTTSMTFGLDGLLYVTSRFEGAVYRASRDGRPEVFATDLGVACGLAFGSDGSLYVGDRSGTVFRLLPGGKAAAFAHLPASVAAFHLAMGPDRRLYVTAPTMATSDVVYCIDSDGRIDVLASGFGRPQGLAFDDAGVLHVVEALAGASGVYRIGSDGTAERVLAGAGLVGVAVDPIHGIALSSNDTLYRLPVRA
jgi:sugar lactone lactonase YvrE